MKGDYFGRLIRDVDIAVAEAKWSLACDVHDIHAQWFERDVRGSMFEIMKAGGPIPYTDEGFHIFVTVMDRALEQVRQL